MSQKKNIPRKEIKPDNYYTIEGHHRGGGLFKVYTHVLGSSVATAKRAMGNEAEEGERLRYVVLDEGATPQNRGEYTQTTTQRVITRAMPWNS